MRVSACRSHGRAVRLGGGGRQARVGRRLTDRARDAPKIYESRPRTVRARCARSDRGSGLCPARLEGIEPPTIGLEVRCSIR